MHKREGAAYRYKPRSAGPIKRVATEDLVCLLGCRRRRFACASREREGAGARQAVDEVGDKKTDMRESSDRGVRGER
jgi:hypothetical protein